MTYKAPGIPDISEASKLEALERIKEIVEVREGVRGNNTSDTALTINRLKSIGVTGWVDDGANFRVTITNGLITGIAASSGAGYAIT